MLKIFADLLMNGEIKIERGTFLLFNQKIVIAPQFFFIELTRNAIADKKRTIELYEMSKKIMRDVFTPKFENRYRLSGDKLVDWMKNIGEFGGWGEFEIADYAEAQKRAIVRIKNSPVGTALQNTASKPVDHIIRGFMAGVACAVFGKDIDYVETKCVAKGDSYCEFIAKEKTDFLNDDSELIREQITLAEPTFETHEKNQH